MEYTLELDICHWFVFLTLLPTKRRTSGSQHSRVTCICSPSQVSSVTPPRASSVRRPKVSARYIGCRRIGTIVLSIELDARSSSGGEYEPNHELSFGTTVLSSEKSMRTRFCSKVRLSAYVAFADSATSLLMEAKNLFEE